MQKLLPAHQRKWRDYPPVLKVGDLSPFPTLLRRLLTTLPKGAFNVQRQVLERSPGELGLSKAVEYDIPIGRREESIRPVTAVGLLAVAI